MEIDGDTNEDNSRRIQVRFVTKLKAPYKVPTTAIAIPSDLSRLGLSSIVNKLLQAGKNFFISTEFPTGFFFSFHLEVLLFSFLRNCGGVFGFQLIFSVITWFGFFMGNCNLLPMAPSKQISVCRYFWVIGCFLVSFR